MADYRNKAAKDAYWAAVREMQRRKFPPQPLPSSLYPPCKKCGLTCYEATLYGTPDGVLCTACMPWKWARELWDHMARVGIKYDAGEHGE